MRIVFTLSTNKVGSQCSTSVPVDDEEWDELDESEREAYAKEMFWDIALDRLGAWDWETKQ